MYYTHRIKPNSPLNLQKDGGYSLLLELSKAHTKGLNKIALPSLDEFALTRSYYSRLIPNARNLAHLIWEDKYVSAKNLLDIWTAIAELNAELYEAALKINPRESPEWLSINFQFSLYVRDLKHFHCDTCLSRLRDLHANSRVREPDTPITWVHGDLHPANLVISECGFRIVDLENLHPAPIFSDFFIFSALSPVDKSFMFDSIQKFSRRYELPVEVLEALKHAVKVTVLQHRSAVDDARRRLESSVHFLFQELCRCVSST